MPDRARPRQRLLAGLAELAIIIAGVLIALWADQWWADRQDLRTQETSLAALDDDISETVGTLRSLMADFESWRDAAATLSGLGGRSADLPPLSTATKRFVCVSGIRPSPDLLHHAKTDGVDKGQSTPPRQDAHQREDRTADECCRQ